MLAPMLHSSKPSRITKMFIFISILILTIIFSILIYNRSRSLEYFGLSPDLKIYSILLKESYIFKYFVGLGTILTISYAAANDVILSFVWAACTIVNIIIINFNEKY